MPYNAIKNSLAAKIRLNRSCWPRWSKPQTGLFQVEEVSRQMHNVTLREATNSRTVILTDIGFSQTLVAGPMIFFRPVQLRTFAMTSGMAFVFPAEMERELRESYRKWQSLDSSERYVRFFRLYRNRGLDLEYAPVGKP